MTRDERAEVDREYLDQAAVLRESNVDGVGEAPEETAGIAGARRGILLSLMFILALVAGAGLAIVYDWATTRPIAETKVLSQDQYNLLWRAADPGNRGYNDSAIGALRGAGYQPVLQQTTDRTRQYFIVLVKCPQGNDYKACAGNTTPQPDPVVYLGLGKELKDGDTLARFNPAQLIVDVPFKDQGTNRCTLQDGQVGEPGTITYDLPATLKRLAAVFGERETQDPDGESLDNLSYWTCKRL